MKPFEVSRAYNRMGAPELLGFAGSVWNSLSSQPAFTSLQPLADTLLAAVTALQQAEAQAIAGGKLERVVRDSRMVDLRAALEKTAMQVELLAATAQDETLVHASGFEQRNAGSRRSYVPLGPAEILSIGRGKNSGTVQGKCRRIGGVFKFALEWSDDNGEHWHNGTYSRGTTFQMVGLTPEKRYWVRAQPLGTHNRKGSWSEPATLFVL